VYTPYLLILTMFSGAGEIIDPSPHPSLVSCHAELARMKSTVEVAWASHGVLRMKGECRDYDPDAWNHSAGHESARPPGLAAAKN